jgi:hypothetical protein
MIANTFPEYGPVVVVNTDPASDPGTDLLQAFCRAEMVAVEAYACAMQETPEVVRDVLSDCLLSHEHRVSLIKQRLQERGAEFPESSGPWGTLMQLVETTAAKLSDRVALDLLRGWEGQRLSDYESPHDELSTDDQHFVENQLLPQQDETHETMVLLTQVVSGGS